MASCSRLFFVLIVFTSSVVADSARFAGVVKDVTGAVIPGATVRLVRHHTPAERTSNSDAQGRFSFPQVVTGKYALTVSADGFGSQTQSLEIKHDRSDVEVTLRPATVSDSAAVFGENLVSEESAADRVPGAVQVLAGAELDNARVFNFGEALRKIPGVNVRDEEGFGLRPNIGLRGLNPTRSSKLLLLEDGVPLAYSVYGDNASYYHPPVERFTAIEVLKGAGQILYGPVTVGGVVNYVTPDPPEKLSGSISLLGGNRNYFDGVARVGGTNWNTGWLVDYMRKQGDGSRENIRSGLNDVTLKLTRNLGAHNLSLKGNAYNEDSNVAYSGLRLDEWLADRRQNPFRNDFFYGHRQGVTLRHSVPLGSKVLLATNVYGAVFTRDWWRQSSNSGQRPNDSADPACAGMTNLNTTCGNEGRQRMYHTVGVDPHARIFYSLFGIRAEADLGFRAHFEKQYRLQRNGATPTARAGNLVEDNLRRTQAYSMFLQNKFVFGRFAITPGVRIEHVDYSRVNRLTGASGRNDLNQAVPGVGAAFILNDRISVFGGVHRGFAPPRVEDVISNAGGLVELDPELSWNYEIGFRSRPFRAAKLDLTFFRMDYENQIVPATLAGGLGAALTNGGQTLHQGLELSGRVDVGDVVGTRHNVFLSGSFTHLPIARFEGVRFSNVSSFNTVSVTGNRLPYAPENTFTGAIGYSHPRGLDLRFEAVFIGDQFGDDLNTFASSADGQRGLLPANNTWNATVNYHLEQYRSTVFVTVKNLFDDTFIVDRARGILPNSPRLIQSGVKYTW